MKIVIKVPDKNSGFDCSHKFLDVVMNTTNSSLILDFSGVDDINSWIMAIIVQLYRTGVDINTINVSSEFMDNCGFLIEKSKCNIFNDKKGDEQ